MTHADRSNKVVSLNLCTDQLALELLPQDAIESLTQLAGDHLYSPQWRKAQGIATNDAQLEELLLLTANKFLLSEYSPSRLSAVLHQLNKSTLSIKAPKNISDLVSMQKQAATFFDMPTREKQQIAALQKIINKPAPKSRVKALLLRVNGFTVGAKTMEHQLMEKAGFENLAALSIESYGFVGLEHILQLQPELILIEDTTNNKFSNGQLLLRHPALTRGLKNTRLVQLEEVFSTCSVKAVLQRFEQLEAIYANYQA